MDVPQCVDRQSIPHLETEVSRWPTRTDNFRSDVAGGYCAGGGRQVVDYCCRLAGRDCVAARSGRRSSDFVRGQCICRQFLGGWKKSLLFAIERAVVRFRIMDEGFGQRKNRK